MRDEDTPARRLAAAHIDARKRLGQHFLLDLNLCRRIARIADPPPDAQVLEVGPGPGGLTQALLETGAAVLAVETDARFLPLLERLGESWPGRLRIVHADALALEPTAVGAAGASVAANLPYNIGTPLLVKWLVGPFRPPAMTLMFQKEVAERIVARSGEDAYGRLAVLARSICDVRLALAVPAAAFTPAPKVDSAVVRLDRRPDAPSDERIAALQRVTRAAFGQRRKMLRSALASLGGAALCREADIDSTRRAEQLGIEEFHALAAALQMAGPGTPG